MYLNGAPITTNVPCHNCFTVFVFKNKILKNTPAIKLDIRSPGLNLKCQTEKITELIKTAAIIRFFEGFVFSPIMAVIASALKSNSSEIPPNI